MWQSFTNVRTDSSVTIACAKRLRTCFEAPARVQKSSVLYTILRDLPSIAARHVLLESVNEARALASLTCACTQFACTIYGTHQQGNLLEMLSAVSSAIWTSVCMGFVGLSSEATQETMMCVTSLTPKLMKDLSWLMKHMNHDDFIILKSDSSMMLGLTHWAIVQLIRCDQDFRAVLTNSCHARETANELLLWATDTRTEDNQSALLCVTGMLSILVSGIQHVPDARAHNWVRILCTALEALRSLVARQSGQASVQCNIAIMILKISHPGLCA
jgi:hypothetical protein